MFKEKTFIASILLVIIAIIAIITQGFIRNPLVSPKNSLVVKSAIDYIKQNYFKDSTVTIANAKWTNGVYDISFKANDQEYKAYVSGNGKWLWSSAPIELVTTPSQASTSTPKTAQPEVKLFTMAFCPFGNQAEYNIIPAVDLLKGSVGVEPHYVIYENYPNNDTTKYKDYCWDASGKYCSMHGKSELVQDVRELCVYKYEKDKYWQFVDAINKKCTSQDVDTCWSGVADTIGLDKTKMNDCVNNEGLDFLVEELALDKEYSVTGSPMLIINKVNFEGSRNPEAYKTGICNAFLDANKPAACNTKLSEIDASPNGSGDSSAGRGS